MDSYRSDVSERTGLFVILKRKIIDHHQRQAYSPFVPLKTSAGAEKVAFFQPEDGHWREGQYPQAWNARADDVLEQQDLYETMQYCQDKLPARHGAVFVLRFVEESSAEEIC